MSRIRPTTFRITLRIALGIVLVLSLSSCVPRNEIADESKTAGCEEDIERALEAFRMSLGLDYFVTEHDLQAALERGPPPKGICGARYTIRYPLRLGQDLRRVPPQVLKADE